MVTWNEADHPRDDDGKFTYKNGGSSSSNIVLEGGVQKTEKGSNSENGKSIGDGVGDVIKDILKGISIAALNPQTIQAVLNILAVKYNTEQLKKIKNELYSYMERNSNSTKDTMSDEELKREKTKQELSAQQEQNERKMQNRADILYPTMKDNLAKSYTEVAELLNEDDAENQIQPKQEHELKNEIAVDHIDNKLLKWYASQNFGLETAENLLMSKKDTYLNTDYAKEHLIFKNYKELNPDLREYFKEKITSQIGADKLETTGGIYINAGHQSSKKLADALVDNQEFIKNVAKERKSLEAGNSVDTSIQFTDNNFQYAIGKADILDMHINKNGNLDLLVTDVYDFNDDKNASDLIKVGRDRQEKGEVIPYFYIYHVIIPKNEKLGKSEKK